MPADHESPPILPDAKPRFIVVTGCNGVGKSTVARAFRDRLAAEVFHFPPDFVRFREAVALDTEVPPLPRLLYYLGATLHLSDLVRRQLARSPVVCDRYVESPLSLLLVDGTFTEADLDQLCAPFLPRVLRPEVTLLLTADYATAQRRIYERGSAHSPTHRLVLQSPDFYRRREATLRAESGKLSPMVELDTTELGPEEMCEAAWASVMPS